MLEVNGPWAGPAWFWLGGDQGGGWGAGQRPGPTRFGFRLFRPWGRGWLGVGAGVLGRASLVLAWGEPGGEARGPGPGPAWELGKATYSQRCTQHPRTCIQPLPHRCTQHPHRCTQHRILCTQPFHRQAPNIRILCTQPFHRQTPNIRIDAPNIRIDAPNIA